MYHVDSFSAFIALFGSNSLIGAVGFPIGCFSREAQQQDNTQVDQNYIKSNSATSLKLTKTISSQTYTTSSFKDTTMDIHVVLAQQSYKHPDNPRRGNTIGSGAYLNRLATLQKIEPDGLLDLEQAALYASDNLGDYSSLFKNAVTFIQSESDKKSEGDEDELPEEQVIEAHDLAYKENRASSIKDAKLIGAAAAIHAYNQFLINGGTSLIIHSNHSNHPDSKSKLIGLAMVEAVKLFDANADGKGQGPKQDAVNYSGITAIKLIKKTQQMSGQGTKSSGVGGISRMIGKIFARLRPQES